MIRPTPRFVVLLAAAVPAAIVAARVPRGGLAVWVVSVAALALSAAYDAARLPGRRRMSLHLDAPRQIGIGTAVRSRVTIEAALAGGTRAEVVVETSDPIEPPPPSIVRASATGVLAEIALSARRRGRGALLRCWVSLTGPLGLVCRTTVIPLDLAIEAIPEVSRSARDPLRAFEARDARVGVKVERYDGEGSEFESLREFRVGDDHRTIDWKASARHRALLRRQFRAERDHDVVLAVDSGRLMAERIDGVPKLDVSVAAALRLALVALGTGDRVGLFGFDERPRVVAPPRGGVRSLAGLVKATSALEPREVDTNFTLSLSTLLESLKRRALVVVLTDFSDTISAELMLENLVRLRRRHAVVFAALDDPALQAMELAPPYGRSALDRAVLAGTIRRERRIVLDRLKRMGVTPIVTPAERLGAAMIDRYLELKRREAV